jgi:hypothetical protein
MLGNETKHEKIHRNPNTYAKEINETNSEGLKILSIKMEIKTIDNCTHSS